MNEPRFLVGKKYSFVYVLDSLKQQLSDISIIEDSELKEYPQIQNAYQFIVKVPDPLIPSMNYDPDNSIPENKVTEYTFERKRLCIDVWECVRKQQR